MLPYVVAQDIERKEVLVVLIAIRLATRPVVICLSPAYSFKPPIPRVGEGGTSYPQFNWLSSRYPLSLRETARPG